MFEPQILDQAQSPFSSQSPPQNMNTNRSQKSKYLSASYREREDYIYQSEGSKRNTILNDIGTNINSDEKNSSIFKSQLDIQERQFVVEIFKTEIDDILDQFQRKDAIVYQADISLIQKAFQNLRDKINSRRQQAELEKKNAELELLKKKQLELELQQQLQQKQHQMSQSKNSINQSLTSLNALNKPQNISNGKQNGHKNNESFTDKFKPVLRSQQQNSYQMSEDKGKKRPKSRHIPSNQAREFDVTRDELLRFKEMKLPTQQQTEEKSKLIQQQLNQGEKDLQQLKKELEVNQTKSRQQIAMNGSSQREASKSQSSSINRHQFKSYKNIQQQKQVISSYQNLTSLGNTKKNNDNTSQKNKSLSSQRQEQVILENPKSNTDNNSHAASIADLERDVSIYSQNINIQNNKNANDIRPDQQQVFQVKKKAQAVQAKNKALEERRQSQNDKEHIQFAKQIESIFSKGIRLNKNAQNCCLFAFNVAKLAESKAQEIDTISDLIAYLNKIGKDQAIEQLKLVLSRGHKIKLGDIESLKKRFKCIKDSDCEFIYKILTDKYGDIYSLGDQEEREQKRLQIEEEKNRNNQSNQKKQNKTQNKSHGGIIEKPQIIASKNSNIKIKDHPEYEKGQIESIANIDIQKIFSQDNQTLFGDCLLKIQPPKGAHGQFIIIEKRNQIKQKTFQENLWGVGENVTRQVKREKQNVQHTFNPQLEQQNKPIQNQVAKSNPLLEESRKLMSKSVVDIRRPSSDLAFPIQNQEYEKKTLLVQDEFVQLFQELQKRRVDRGDPKAFYHAVNDFYKEGTEPHDSPTRRLIDHKNTAVDHKQTIRSSKERLGQSDYSLTYTTGPEKSYVIEPHGGSLDYNLVQKDPAKFYEDFFNQDLTKHTIKAAQNQQQRSSEVDEIKNSQDGLNLKDTLKKRRLSGSSQKSQTQITTKTTKRPHLKIMDKIKQKIAQRLSLTLKNQISLDRIQNILSDRGINENIESLYNLNKIQIVNQNGDEIIKGSQTFLQRSNSNAGLNLKIQNKLANEDESPSRLIIDDKDFLQIQKKVNIMSKKSNYLNK